MHLHRDLGVLAIRLAFGYQLIAGAWAYASSPSVKMPEFMGYLTTIGFPFPTVGAYLAIYTELIGGLLWVLGYQTRLASALLLINFTVAVMLAHVRIGDSYANTFPSLNIWVISLFLLLNGAGRYSVGEWLHQRKWQ
ncbi:hypothetical protein FAES_0559 [Fibrella aestuarina BUZ 2]|uniref:DoxX family protein n=1 Tax=Fibrella aestuarina BUZ 2 TaxID=1166018 RepID=I0K367_9BACT|nr:DoxX family protein [Fibrella aestuarina]CCG98570.1 hypothetical protein FAES_0559 [Fibrella aestuarina BUZ 2]